MITKEQLKEYIEAYMAGKPIIPDSEYDVLLEEYLREHGEENRPYLRQKQPGNVQSLVGTLKKVYGVITPMRPELDTYQNWVNRKGINPNARIVIQPKFDGASVAYDFYTNKFFTRGDYENGESVDVTDLFINHSIPRYLHHEIVDGVKFEAIMCHENFYGVDAFRKYEKPLDAVNAIIHSRNAELAKYITLVPLRYSSMAHDGGDLVSREVEGVSITTTTATDLDCIQQFITDKLNDGANVVVDGLHYSIDGVVVSVINNNNETQEEVAIKILNDINTTKLIDVQFQFGKTGKITPVAIVEPVQFCDGKRTVDHITLSTLDRVNKMDLRKGDTVRVMYNIVPYLMDTAHDGNERIELPRHCPKCGAPFEYTSLKTVRCTNPICAGRKLGSIIRYCEKMKMLGVGEATVTILFNAGLLKGIEDLYTLEASDIMTLPGFKDVSANNIIRSIRASSADVPVSRWLGALPFLDVDSKKWDLLLNETIGNDELRKGNIIRTIINSAPERFVDLIATRVKGLGTSTVKAMNEGFIVNRPMMEKVIQHISFRITSSVEGVMGKVCLSGTRDKNVIQHLTELGYDVSVSLTKDTTILVVPDKSYTSSKSVKAQTMGIKILTIEEAMGLN